MTEDLPYSLPMISPLGEGRGDMWRTLRMRSRLPQLRTKRLDVFTTSARNPRCQSWHGRRRSRYREVVDIDEGIRRTIAWEQSNPPTTIDPQQFNYDAEDAALASGA